MKKILIIGMSLEVGGAERSLVNFLNLIDFTIYEVDLLLFQNIGAFTKYIPIEVNQITIHEIEILYQSASATLRKFDNIIKDFGLIIQRYISSFIEIRKWKQFDQARLHRWLECYRYLIPNLEKGYEAAIAYAGGETAYYMMDKVNADRKVYFFHSDYSKIDIDADLERQYVDKADSIITVSNVCRKSLVHLFPEKAEDIYVLANLSSSKLIHKLALQYYPGEFDVSHKKLKIVSVGRLEAVKGFDLAVKAAGICKKKGMEFMWIIVGEGNERRNLEVLIKEMQVSDCFRLVGLKENPYPYIYYSDILIQTSRLEGKSVVLDEARILGKPAIITNYNSANDQIRNGIDGLIVDMSPESIAEAIFHCDFETITKFKNNVKVDSALEDIEKYMDCLLGI